jgi:hypothetical protein
VDTGPYPVIDDPRRPPDGAGQLGDIEHQGGLFVPPELFTAWNDCEAAWLALEDEFGVEMPGVIGLNLRLFVLEDHDVPGAPYMEGIADSDVTCTPQFPSVLCTDPEALEANTGGRFAVMDNDFWSADSHLNRCPQNAPCQQRHTKRLAHELGHVMGLGHGDGIDNDGDGLMDDCCDREEQEGNDISLMSVGAPSSLLTQEQVTLSRAAARVTPGATEH